MSADTAPRLTDKADIAAWLVDWISRELQMQAGEIDTARSLLEYSLSSVTATILVGDLEDRFDLRLPPTLVWDYPSINAMVDFVAARLAEGGEGSAPLDALPADIDSLSDDEVDALLKQLSA